MLTPQEAKSRGEWLLHSHGLEGFKAYYATRYYGILQSLAGGVEKDSEYYVNIGRRLELLHLLGETKQEFDRNNRTNRKKDAVQK